MGLDCSHGAFSASCGAFDRFRKRIAACIGGSWPPHEDSGLEERLWYWGDGYCKDAHPGLYEFFSHSDDTGEISPGKCALIADDLEALLPKLAAMSGDEGAGHIQRDGGYVKVTGRFIAGCRLAASRGEPLIFE